MRLSLVRLALAAALLVPVSSCGSDDDSSVVVTTRVIEEAPFETYQTFTVLTPELVPEAPPLSPDGSAAAVLRAHPDLAGQVADGHDFVSGDTVDGDPWDPDFHDTWSASPASKPAATMARGPEKCR